MVIKRANLFHVRRVVADITSRLGNIFQILATTRIRTVSRSYESQRVLNSVVTHFPERVREQRLPVAVAKINRKVWTTCLQLVFQSGNQLAILFVDGTDAAEEFVVLCDLKQALARDVSTAQYVFEKGNYVVHSFRPAKGNDQNCIERRVHLSSTDFRKL